MVWIEFDAAKNEANIAKHGVDMVSAEQFEFDTALVTVDTRQSYNEIRHVATGYIEGRLHVLVFTKRGSKVRVISLRKANRREERASTVRTRKKPRHIAQKDWDEVDSPPLTDEELANMRPLREIFPDMAEYAAKRKRGQRGPQKAPTKKPVTIRVDPDVLDTYKATGPGWQSRMNDVLRRGAKSV